MWVEATIDLQLVTGKIKDFPNQIQSPMINVGMEDGGFIICKAANGHDKAKIRIV